MSKLLVFWLLDEDSWRIIWTSVIWSINISLQTNCSGTTIILKLEQSFIHFNHTWKPQTNCQLKIVNSLLENNCTHYGWNLDYSLQESKVLTNHNWMVLERYVPVCLNFSPVFCLDIHNCIFLVERKMELRRVIIALTINPMQ